MGDIKLGGNFIAEGQFNNYAMSLILTDRDPADLRSDRIKPSIAYNAIRCFQRNSLRYFVETL